MALSDEELRRVVFDALLTSGPVKPSRPSYMWRTYSKQADLIAAAVSATLKEKQ